MEKTAKSPDQWSSMIRLGGLAALLSFCVTLFDIIFGSIITGGSIAGLSQTATDRFIEMQANPLLGIYHLDFLDLINALIMLPVFFALFAVHRRQSPGSASFASLLCLFGTTLFVSANSALPMLELSKRYFAVTDSTQKMLIAAAGEAMLARGEHSSLGVFLGFTILTLASLSISIVMFQGATFSKRISLLGLVGHSLLLVYIVLVTFIPEVHGIAVALATPGGLLALFWLLMIGVTLLRGKSPEQFYHTT